MSHGLDPSKSLEALTTLIAVARKVTATMSFMKAEKIIGDVKSTMTVLADTNRDDDKAEPLILTNPEFAKMASAHESLLSYPLQLRLMEEQAQLLTVLCAFQETLFASPYWQLHAYTPRVTVTLYPHGFHVNLHTKQDFCSHENKFLMPDHWYALASMVMLYHTPFSKNPDNFYHVTWTFGNNKEITKCVWANSPEEAHHHAVCKHFPNALFKGTLEVFTPSKHALPSPQIPYPESWIPNDVYA